MRSFYLNSGLKLLLAAAVLVGSVMPPAIQHAHAGGDKTHDHWANKQHTPHRHSHHHGERNKVAEEQKAHRHLHLFGFDLHLPVNESPTTPGRGNQSSGEELILVRLLDTDAAMTSQQSVERLFVTVPSLATISPETAGLTLQSDQRERSTSNPLCDSARCERSGVLLI